MNRQGRFITSAINGYKNNTKNVKLQRNPLKVLNIFLYINVVDIYEIFCFINPKTVPYLIYHSSLGIFNLLLKNDKEDFS